MKNILIRNAEESDLSSIASTHCKCFKGYLISLLGTNLIQRYYKSFLNEAPELFFIAENERGSILGFVMGYFPGSTAREIFIKSNLPLLVLKTGLLCLRFKKVAWGIVTNRISLAISHLFGYKKILGMKSKEKYTDLLSICVLKEFQGSGISLQLVNSFELAIKAKNYNCYTLSTGSGNIRAKSFYIKSGMKIKFETPEEITFIKEI